MKPLLIVIGLTLVTFTPPAYPHERDSISDGLTDELLRPASEVSDMDNAPGAFKNQMDLGTRISVLVPDYGKISDMNIPFQPGLRVNPNAARLSSMGFIPGVAMLDSWGSGGIFATGSRQDLPGLMGIESGALNFRQQVGAFTLSLFGSVTKYGYFNGLATSYGFGGSLSYEINEHLGVTVFGSYNSPTGINQAAMMGYVATPTFGGYLNWRFHPHWGVKVGAQSYRSVAYGRRETQPIVMPYYRTSGGAEIGIDVGGILYQVIRSASGNSWGNPGNPTIDPRPSGVYVRPRIGE